MTTILLVDDQLHKRNRLIEVMINQYEIAETDQADQTSMMIEKLSPSIVLINRLSLNFNAVSLFLNIKKLYPKMPVLLYALNGAAAIQTLKQTIAMALTEKKDISEIKHDQAASFFFDQNRGSLSFLR